MFDLHKNWLPLKTSQLKTKYRAPFASDIIKIDTRPPHVRHITFVVQ